MTRPLLLRLGAQARINGISGRLGNTPWPKPFPLSLCAMVIQPCEPALSLSPWLAGWPVAFARTHTRGVNIKAKAKGSGGGGRGWVAGRVAEWQSGTAAQHLRVTTLGDDGAPSGRRWGAAACDNYRKGWLVAAKGQTDANTCTRTHALTLSQRHTHAHRHTTLATGALACGAASSPSLAVP